MNQTFYSDGNNSGWKCTSSFTRTSKIKPPRIEDVFWGPDYSDENIKTVHEEHGYKAKYIRNIEETIADLLAKGMIVGRFNGKMEYGPRALGNRSILCSANDPKINVTLNKKLKRTEFMPFAPVIRSETAKLAFKNFFTDDLTLRFMTSTIDCSNEFLDTDQPTNIIIIQNKLPIGNNPYVLSMNNSIIFNTVDGIERITELCKDSITLDQLGFDVHVGTVVWNQVKDTLTDNNNKLSLFNNNARI